MSKIATNISGGALVTLIAVFLYQAGIGHHLDKVIIGSIIPLVPGVNFTNAIRDIADQDYIAGSVRMLDALLVTFCIALGVGLDYHRVPSTGRRAAAMSDTIRLIAEFFAACVGTIAFALLFQVPRKYYLYCGLAGCLRLDLLQTDPSVYDRAGIDLFCNGARHHSVAQLRGIQALPGNGISDCGNFSAGAGKRHLLDCFLRGNK